MPAPNSKPRTKKPNPDPSLVDLVGKHLKRMGKEVRKVYFGTVRPRYNGKDHDILVDYVVLTTPDDRGEWVVWSGCFRGPIHDLRATTFQGHYSTNLFYSGAIEEIKKRLSRMTITPKKLY